MIGAFREVQRNDLVLRPSHVEAARIERVLHIVRLLADSFFFKGLNRCRRDTNSMRSSFLSTCAAYITHNAIQPTTVLSQVREVSLEVFLAVAFPPDILSVRKPLLSESVYYKESKAQ